MAYPSNFATECFFWLKIRPSDASVQVATVRSSMHLSPNAHEISLGLTGGIVIGLSSTLYLYTTGSMSGMSGIIRTLLGSWDNNFSSVTESAFYVGGLVVSGIVLKSVAPNVFGPAAASHVTITAQGAAIAGILVGMGSSLGNGCTSGHGVCGLGRRSPRSLAAVMTFMASGAWSAYYFRDNAYIFRASNLPSSATAASSTPILIAAASSLALFTLLPMAIDSLIGVPRRRNGASLVDKLPQLPLVFGNALLFGVGLGISGMCNPAKVLGFLDFSHPAKGFDPSLAGVMGGAVLLNLGTFWLYDTLYPKNITLGLKGSNLVIDWQVLAGSALFGVGWGIGGMCPGPALVSIGAGRASALMFVPWMLCGISIHKALNLHMVSDDARRKLSN